ncbi:DUF288 domain-containing protein [Patescibacteria group bacterium]|nr:DUF288 domain-containing protein [Patescibacteria group bacterium]
MKKFIIITTINKKTEAIIKFSKKLKDWNIILVGDKKSKNIKNEKNILFLSLKDQKNLGFETFNKCPYNHYTRKNLGYLYAIKNGADIIYDTDDDNLPYNNWSFPDFKIKIDLFSNKKSFINIYNLFTKEKIWPRGYPINRIKEKNKWTQTRKNIKIGVWQGLADIEPDVDSLYRLIIGKKIKFKKRNPLALDKETYCPFNSQNTLWNKEFFYYLYLPSTVSFRFTDILRGYITQKLLWLENYYLGFTNASVYQKRNEHDLMKDFYDEISVFVNVENIIKLFSIIKFKNKNNKAENIKKIYNCLYQEGFVKKEEIIRLNAWLYDIKKIESEFKN